jgi:hypothetical protein
MSTKTPPATGRKTRPRNRPVRHVEQGDLSLRLIELNPVDDEVLHPARMCSSHRRPVRQGNELHDAGTDLDGKRRRVVIDLVEEEGLVDGAEGGTAERDRPAR